MPISQIAWNFKMIGYMYIIKNYNYLTLNYLQKNFFKNHLDNNITEFFW